MSWPVYEGIMPLENPDRNNSDAPALSPEKQSEKQFSVSQLMEILPDAFSKVAGQGYQNGKDGKACWPTLNSLSAQGISVQVGDGYTRQVITALLVMGGVESRTIQEVEVKSPESLKEKLSEALLLAEKEFERFCGPDYRGPSVEIAPHTKLLYCQLDNKWGFHLTSKTGWLRLADADLSTQTKGIAALKRLYTECVAQKFQDKEAIQAVIRDAVEFTSWVKTQG